MSANSGIGVAPELAALFANANARGEARFINISISNEILVSDATIPSHGTFESDLEILQDILKDDVPAYILARKAPSDWLAICYVPDSAKVRDKMLYASTRASLLKSLGSTLFTDTIFATSKADLTPEAYTLHQRHIAAPKPLSAREQEMADIRAAESGGVYEGSRTRSNHIGTGVGLPWSQEVEDAVKSLGAGDACTVVVIKLDPKSETLVLNSVIDTTVESLGRCLPTSEPCYAFFAWPHEHTSPPRREIIFVYSCPSTSPIKYRMVYSSGASSTFSTAKSLLSPSNSVTFASRKIETSDPSEINEIYLKSELGYDSSERLNQGQRDGGTSRNWNDSEKQFAKPRGPARKR